tara:strand:- start:49 stop:336 length:288 start_codon:yes stop_codon:yes gene_type:complete
MKITKTKLKQLIREAMEDTGESGDAISTFFANNQPPDDSAYLVYELDVFARMVGMEEQAVGDAIHNASDPDVPYVMGIRDVEGEPHVFIRNRHNV